MNNIPPGNSELKAGLGIAAPLALAALVNMGISITDVVMMGWLGHVVLAAGAAVSDYYSIIFYLSAGVIAALSPLISAARGSNNIASIGPLVINAFWIALLLSVMGVVLVILAPFVLQLIDAEEALVVEARLYAPMMAITYVNLLFVRVWHQFFAAHEHSDVIFHATLVILPLNALGNYIFMFGKIGLPVMGITGIGLSSVLTTGLMLIWLTVVALRNTDYKKYWQCIGWRPEKKVFLKMFRLGAPIGLSSLGEMGIYLFSTVIIATFGSAALAAHTIAIRLGGLLFAVPLGLSQAMTVRTGLAFGAGNANQLQLVLQAHKKMGAAWLISIIVVLWFLVFPFIEWLVEKDPAGSEYIGILGTLFILTLLMQPIDYVLTVLAGYLRGVQDTKVPMQMILFGYWLVGFPIGLWLAYSFDFAAIGIWLGLLIGVITSCLLLIYRFYSTSEKVTHRFK